LILHVGDLTSAEFLEELGEIGPVAAVHGNMDAPRVRAELPARLVTEAEGLRIGLVHDAGPAPGRHARLLEAFPNCEVIAYGHTHLPEVTRAAGSWIVNPGSPTERRRAPGHTMIVIEAGEPELVALDP
jgi:putative phosphoesterase